DVRDHSRIGIVQTAPEPDGVRPRPVPPPSPSVIPALVNDAAGTAAQAREALEQAGEFTVRDVAPDEMERVLREELKAHPKRILVAGGDGTIGTAAALLQGTNTELAIFPGGTLNHF